MFQLKWKRIYLIITEKENSCSNILIKMKKVIGESLRWSGDFKWLKVGNFKENISHMKSCVFEILVLIKVSLLYQITALNHKKVSLM